MTPAHLSAAVQQKVTSLQNDLDRGLSRIFDPIVTGFVPNSIPENVFVGYFLPSFIGGTQNPNWVAEWVSVAGTPSAEVSVVDIQGNILFQVPPLLSTQSLSFGTGGIRFNHIANEAHLRENSLAGKEGFLTAAMYEKTTQMQNADTDRVSLVWNSILTRYGYVQPPPAVQPQQPSTASDMFEY